MNIVVAKSSGFCFGVDQAVKAAYEVLSDKNRKMPTYMLGEITHNETVVSDLLSRGIVFAQSLDEIQPNSTVIIRAHGITPELRAAIAGKECDIVDCTCPFVSKIHQIVKEAGIEGMEILLAGTEGHPEVEGICGEAEIVRVIGSVGDLKNIKWEADNTVLLSQTTFSAEEFVKIQENIKNKIANEQIFDTICSTTENRQREASDLASVSNYMFVIGSERSSNTMKLFEICKSRCAETYLLGDAKDLIRILPEMDFRSDDVQIGITAGASTPDSIIREVIRTMSENQATANHEQPDINFGDYIDNIPQLRKNATVRGAITSADNEFVYVDVHDKSEGRIPRHEFASDPDFDLDAAIEEHREIEVYVRSVRNSDMGKEILLSKAHVDFGKYKAQVEEAYEDKIPVTVKVTNVVKDGVIANFGGVDIYIHRTQLDLSTVDDLDSYKGKALEILITQYDPDKRRLRVSGSRRALLNNLRREKANEVWETIEVGSEFDGIVRSLTDFGAFVDIGGVDGLVHISELSWNRIRHPSEIVSVGETIHVYVKDFDSEKKRISLGYKKSEDDPYHNIEERFPIGSIVNGKVVRMFQFGAFVELEPGLDALCHVSQISNVRLNKPDDVLSEGMEIVARVLDVNNDSRRISISIKEVEPIDPEISENDEEVAGVPEIKDTANEEAKSVEEITAEEAPIVEEPAEATEVIEEPVTEEVSADEATTEEEPVTEEVSAEEATTEEEPVTEEVSAEEVATVEEPVVEEPIV
jgi:4-hydroxy-3-methylbut-2-enyl diphosphate reductase